ncbi:MAG: ester cyclase [Bdellovibrionaceae bacterium]|nr:ester cyclase [Pseudobdellovibrionaceae bacterium]
MKVNLMSTAIALITLLVVGTAGAKDKKSTDFEALEKQVKANLATFDKLDFEYFSKQDWVGFRTTHTKNVKVHWPDGHVTEGLDKHVEDLQYMFSYAPDTRIMEHPIKIGQGDWTAVYGIMEGTFTKPMKMPDGKVIQPTGKKFKIPMATIAHWTKEGPMDEEYLFWDNQTYLNQLGIGTK